MSVDESRTNVDLMERGLATVERTVVHGVSLLMFALLAVVLLFTLAGIVIISVRLVRFGKERAAISTHEK